VRASTTDDRPGRYPTWVRAALVALQVLAVVGGLVVGHLTYEAWSRPDDPAPTPTAVTPTPPAPSDTLD
jgi:hypothetical protein